MPRERPLSLNDLAVLCMIAERDCHGFAVARALARDGSLGRIWTVPRPVVYRSIDQLVTLELVEPVRIEEGERGPRRTVMRATADGRAKVRRWLRAPVAHIRDVRTELMLKFALLERRGESVTTLAARQLHEFGAAFAALEATAARHGGPDRLIDLWRVESSRSIEDFLRRLADPESTP